MQLSVLCIDKKLKENFWYAFEKNLCNLKHNSEENGATIERVFYDRGVIFIYIAY